MAIANGTTLTLGDGTDKPIGVRFMTHAAALRRRLLDPEFRLGESYMNGTFVVAEGSVSEVVEFGMAPTRRRIGCGRKRWRDIFGRDCRQLAGQARFQKKVARHYDELEKTFYSLFLDADRQYSCAYFETPNHLSKRPSMPRGNTSQPSC